MNAGVSDKLLGAAAECRLHADILAEALLEHGDVRYSADEVPQLERARLRMLDQMAYRYTKLQSTLGERLLPLMLELTEEPIAPDAAFSQKLQRLERLGIIPSADQWRTFRQTRNALAHEYPDAPEIKAALLNHFIGSVGELVEFWRHVEQRISQLVRMQGV